MDQERTEANSECCHGPVSNQPSLRDGDNVASKLAPPQVCRCRGGSQECWNLRKACVEAGMADTWSGNSASGNARQINGHIYGGIHNYISPVPDQPKHRYNGEDLLRAAENSQAHLLEDILTEGVDKNHQGRDGCTALHRAAQHGHLQVVQRLIKAGCKMDLVSFDFGTPLCEAAHKGYVDIVETLIKAGANTNEFCCSRGSALHAACFSGHKSIVEILLRAKARSTEKAEIIYARPIETDAGTVHYFTRIECQPMWLAIYRGHAELIPLLASSGASGKVSSWYSRARKPTKTLDGVCFESSEVKPAVHAAMVHEDIIVLQEVILAGGDVDALDESGLTPLEYGAKEGMLEHVKVLIEGGANVNHVRLGGYTALEDAARSRHREIAEVLILNGAKLDSEFQYQHMRKIRDITEEMYHFLTDAREWTFM